MEIRTPHCKLAVVKRLIETGYVRATASAYVGARELGIHDLAGMCRLVLSLTTADFYKSMTAYHDHTLWRDVYRPHTPVGDVYLKLIVIDDVLIVSLKRL